MHWKLIPTILSQSTIGIAAKTILRTEFIGWSSYLITVWESYNPLYPWWDQKPSKDWFKIIPSHLVTMPLSDISKHIWEDRPFGLTIILYQCVDPSSTSSHHKQHGVEIATSFISSHQLYQQPLTAIRSRAEEILQSALPTASRYSMEEV